MQVDEECTGRLAEQQRRADAQDCHREIGIIVSPLKARLLEYRAVSGTLRWRYVGLHHLMMPWRVRQHDAVRSQIEHASGSIEPQWIDIELWQHDLVPREALRRFL